MLQNDFVRAEELRATLARINSAPGQSELSALYVQLVGYCPFEDDSESTVDSVRQDLRDYMREVCYSEGFHVSEIFGDD